MLMQYLPQQQQPAGGLQYLQLIPTRPLIVPISPYITPQFASAAQQHQQGYAAASPAIAQHHGGYGQPAPTHFVTPYGATVAGHSIQNPVGGYSSPIVSYFRPHSGIQLVNGPVDMSLNTNEYIPVQGDAAYKNRKAN